MGRIYAAENQQPQANEWFTRAVLLDPMERTSFRGKAYWSLAENLASQNRFSAAAFAANKAYERDPSCVQVEQAQKWIDQMRRSPPDGIQILRLSGADGTTLQPRGKIETLQSITLKGDPIDETIRRLLPDPKGTFVLGLISSEELFYYLIDTTVSPPVVRKIPLPAPAYAGCLVDGKLYLVLGKIWF